MVFAILRLFPTPKHRAHVLEILESVRDLTIVRPGCLGAWFYEMDVRRRQICYGEEWSSEEALHEHLSSDLYRQVLAVLELSDSPPEVTFFHASNTQSFELIEAVRRRHTAAES